MARPKIRVAFVFGSAARAASARRLTRRLERRRKELRRLRRSITSLEEKLARAKSEIWLLEGELRALKRGGARARAPGRPRQRREKEALLRLPSL